MGSYDVLFIDANQYLDLYRLHDGPKVLEKLLEQQDHIFVTAQIVDEVQRNKVAVAAKFFLETELKIEVTRSGMPLLFGKKAVGEMNDKLKELKQRVKDFKGQVQSAAVETLKQISRSDDEVSKGLEKLFEKAVQATEEEKRRARDRKEDWSGTRQSGTGTWDQISWEQFLGQCIDAPTRLKAE